MTGRQGVRGGRTASLAEALTLFETFKGEESRRVRNVIMYLALKHGTFHSELLAELPVSEPNIIGAQVNALLRGGMLVEVDRRKGSNTASNGRKSGVYAVTPAGLAKAPRSWRQMARERSRQDVTPIPKAPPRRVDPLVGARVRARGRCQLCGAQPAGWPGLTWHHIVPRGSPHFGDDSEDNGACLCGTGTTGCHGDVEARRPEALARFRASMTQPQLDYVIEKKGAAWLDRRYPAGEVAA